MHGTSFPPPIIRTLAPASGFSSSPVRRVPDDVMPENRDPRDEAGQIYSDEVGRHGKPAWNGGAGGPKHSQHSRGVEERLRDPKRARPGPWIEGAGDPEDYERKRNQPS